MPIKPSPTYLTPKQERFATEYVVDLNSKRAAIAAGYSTKSDQGRKLLFHPAVKARVAELKAEQAKRTATDADWVLREARALYERCMQEIKPAVDRKGKPLVDEDGRALFTFNAAGAARALEIVGRHVQVAAFEERHVHSVDFDPVAILQHGREMSRQRSAEDEEARAALARERERRAGAIDATFEPIALPAPKPRKPRTPSPIAAGGSVVKVVPGKPQNEPRPSARHPQRKPLVSRDTTDPAIALLQAGRDRASLNRKDEL